MKNEFNVMAFKRKEIYMKVIGKEVTCDRCGERIMLKRTGKFDLNGEYTGVEKYEELPDGWRYLCDSDKDLCPNCAKDYDRLMEEFYKVITNL